jgi:hypothetical protein
MAQQPGGNPTFNPGGLYNRLLNNATTSVYGLGGQNISTMPGAIPGSRLHNTYSINGIPTFSGKPTPSLLDLDGNTPVRYWDIRPQ